MKRLPRWAMLLLFVESAYSQQSSPTSTGVPSISQTISVSAAAEPLPLQEGDRSVNVIAPREQSLLINSAVDLLRSDSSLNVQARAGDGVQADLSIRGTTFEQSLVLLNGLRINDPETGHLNLDIPIPLDSITRIDVLHGSGSTFYGSDAIGGAVNLLTEAPQDRLTLVASAGGGSYSSLEQHFRASYMKGLFDEQLAGSRDTSDGFIPDRNYSNNAVSSETWLKLKPGTTDILLAASDRPYGANLFYGPYDSWERTKGWFASVQQQLGERTSVSFGYRRHSDLFVLFADQPSIYENNHVTTSYEGVLRRTEELGGNKTLSYGLEADGDAIHSSSLGQHARNQGAGYASLSLRALGRFSLSLGARDAILSGGDNVFSPSLAAAYMPSHSTRVRVAAGHGFRLPTYVDLYYSDPTTIGNPSLRPESSWSYEAGIDWTPRNGRVTLAATGFRLQQKDTIDYSKLALASSSLTFSEPYQAVNVQNLDITGAEGTLSIRLSDMQHLRFSYTAAHAASPPPGVISEYAFNYAAQNALFVWDGQLPGHFGHQITAQTSVNLVQKTTRTVYPLWNIEFARNVGRLRPYARLANLANTGYQEIPQVPMEGRSFIAGVQFQWSRR